MKKIGCKGFVALLNEFKAIRLCVSGCGAVEIQFNFSEEHEHLGTEAHREVLIRYITPRENMGKEGSIGRRDAAL